MAEYGQLRRELDSDPAKYSGTPQEVSDILNTPSVAVVTFSLESAEIYEVVDDGEAESLAGARDKARLAEIYSLSGSIPFGVGSRVQTVLESLFDAGGATRAGLAALNPPNITRAQEIGLGEGRTRASDVTKARAL